VKISQELVDELVAHAREDLPNECCGLIGGEDGVATKVVRVANAAASPLRYEMDPQGQFDALKEIGGGTICSRSTTRTPRAPPIRPRPM
jgi:proteasome lid subunit RPN8/RPN11